MTFDFLKYLSVWPQIEAAFARAGVTLTLAQAVAIAEDLWQIFKPAAPPAAPPPAPPVDPPPPAPPEVTPFTADQIAAFYLKYLGRVPESAAVVNEWMHDPHAESNIRNTPEAQAFAAAHGSTVNFDHKWTGAVELQLQRFLATGMAGPDGANGQAVIDKMNAIGGSYAGGEFQAHHDGPQGFPTYGFPWFYVSYVPMNDGSGHGFYQIVEFGTPPAGN
ncbi:MAG TPA: hypothetical protein VKQ05_01840 [Gemmatimonadales bacterium]|nr:hypothetical protein [Gemmatimonadales bacterium]